VVADAGRVNSEATGQILHKPIRGAINAFDLEGDVGRRARGMATVRRNADTTMKSDQQLLTPKATASRLLHPTAVKGQWRVVATTLGPPSLITVGQTFCAKTSHAVQMSVEFGHRAPLYTNSHLGVRPEEQGNQRTVCLPPPLIR
jgi:hypothetical protein